MHAGQDRTDFCRTTRADHSDCVTGLQFHVVGPSLLTFLIWAARTPGATAIATEGVFTIRLIQLTVGSLRV
jgi:hypothetical protein